LIGQMLTKQVHLSIAEQMYEQPLAGYEKAVGRDHTSAPDAVNDLGNLYQNQ